jgi:steroid delta-isomerase-like uncharacterized protein
MSAEDNKTLARRFLEEAYSQGRLELLDQLLAPDYADRDAPPGFPANRDGVRVLMRSFRTAFPDLRFEIDDELADGDRVAVRYTVTGTQQGPLMGLPPTGKSIRIRGISIYRIAEGKLQEAWVQYDALGMMQQLGAVPVPAGT